MFEAFAYVERCVPLDYTAHATTSHIILLVTPSPFSTPPPPPLHTSSYTTPFPISSPPHTLSPPHPHLPTHIPLLSRKLSWHFYRIRLFLDFLPRLLSNGNKDVMKSNDCASLHDSCVLSSAYYALVHNTCEYDVILSNDQSTPPPPFCSHLL